MSDLALYLCMAAAGYFAGGRLKDAQRIIKWTGRLQTAAIVILIFTMGMRMGSNRQVMENLNSIGLYALIITAAVIAGAAGAIFVSRKLMGIDRLGHMEAKTASEEAEAAAPGKDDGEGKDMSMTWIILICVTGGLAFGHFAVSRIFSDMDSFDRLAGTLIDAGLCTLLFFVGFDMGRDGTVFSSLRKVGLRVLAFPFIIMAGTLAGAGVCALFLPLTLRETLAIGGGFGWYSFAPAIIMDKGLVTASAVSFMHNILREYISLLIIPLVARKIGYLEAMAVSGCSSMDVCLPVVERSTRSDIALYSFISGVIQSMAVPVVVPLILG